MIRYNIQLSKKKKKEKNILKLNQVMYTLMIFRTSLVQVYLKISKHYVDLTLFILRIWFAFFVTANSDSSLSEYRDARTVLKRDFLLERMMKNSTAPLKNLPSLKTKKRNSPSLLIKMQ